MKKQLWLSALFTVCTSAAAFSQWSLGVSAGPSMAFRDWKFVNPGPISRIEYDPGMGVQASMMSEIAFNPVLSIRGEAGYQAWTSRLPVTFTDGNGADASGTLKDRLNALTLGIQARVNPFRQVPVYFLAGSTGALILSDVLVSKVDEPALPEQGKRVNRPLEEVLIEPAQYFINVGAGTTIDMGTHGRLLLEGRYQAGLSNLSSSSAVDARIRSVMLNVGYLYRL